MYCAMNSQYLDVTIYRKVERLSYIPRVDERFMEGISHYTTTLHDHTTKTCMTVPLDSRNSSDMHMLYV
jgi:hypothetical protein